MPEAVINIVDLPLESGVMCINALALSLNKHHMTLSSHLTVLVFNYAQIKGLRDVMKYKKTRSRHLLSQELSFI